MDDKNEQLKFKLETIHKAIRRKNKFIRKRKRKKD